MKHSLVPRLVLVTCLVLSAAGCSGVATGTNPPTLAASTPTTASNRPTAESAADAALNVPDLTKLTEAEARKFAQQAGLTVAAIDNAYSSDVPAGFVISTNPRAGVTAQSGAAIKLTVSQGREPTS